MKPRHAGLPLALLMLGASVVVLADEPDARVARVSYAGGDVSYQRGDSDGWNALGVNTPLVTGDALYTADDGRAEVQIGSGNVLRLDTGTQVDLVSNTRDLAQLGLRSGYLSLRARSGSESGAIEIDTPNGAATVVDPGIYRVEMTDDTARYSVVKGRLSVALAGQQLDVDAGETLTIEGTDQPRYSFGPIAPQSPFDTWAHDRDVRADRAASARYVHRDVVGYEDLDGNGTWRDTPNYGRVWMPSGVSAGWAPYQAGSWMWQDPYGWTWVSDEPWGWAPYHYGRWVFVRGYWGWAPGPVVVRPVYAPALVVFLGGPVAVAARPVRWAPLGWGEPVVPWWGRPGFVGVAWWGGWGGPRVVNNVVVNRTTTVNVTNINVYSNVNVHNAVVGVPEDRFGRGGAQITRVSDAQVKELTPVRGPLQVKPAAASVMSADRATLTPPAAARDRSVVATRAPRDFSPSLRAEGLSAPREATASAAAPRIVPAPKRTVAVAPPEGQNTGQRPPRPADTPNARRPDPGSAPNTAPGAPRSGSRNAPAQPDSRQSKPPASDEGDAGRKLNPPPPPPHNSADGRQARPHGGAGNKGRQPEAKHGQPQQRSGERPPETKEKPAEK